MASLILSSSKTGMAVVYEDEFYTFAYVGENLARFLGHTKEEFSKHFLQFRQICAEEDFGAVMTAIQEQLQLGDSYEVEYRVRHRMGKLIWVLERGNRVIDEDGRALLICVLCDYDREKKVRDRLILESTLDPLTQVYNRTAARTAIETYLQKDNQHYYAAFILIDLDNFKLVNDVYGHMEGDVVLQETANLLSMSVNTEDIVARLGGDEFMVFIKRLKSEYSIRTKAEAICQGFEEKFGKHFDQIHLTISAGVVPIFRRKTPFTLLYKFADRALYRAKCNGKNTFELEYPLWITED